MAILGDIYLCVSMDRVLCNPGIRNRALAHKSILDILSKFLDMNRIFLC